MNNMSDRVNIDDCVLLIVSGKDKNMKLKTWIENNTKDNAHDVQLLKVVNDKSNVALLKPNDGVKPAENMSNLEQRKSDGESRNKIVLTNTSKSINRNVNYSNVNYFGKIKNILAEEATVSEAHTNLSQAARSLLKVKNENVIKKLNKAEEQKTDSIKKLQGYIFLDKSQNKIFTLTNNNGKSVDSVSPSSDNKDSKSEIIATKEAAALTTNEIEACGSSSQFTYKSGVVRKTLGNSVKSIKGNWHQSKSASDKESSCLVKDNDHWKNMFKPRPPVCYPCAEAISLRKIGQPYPFKIINFLESDKANVDETMQISRVSNASSSQPVEQVLEKQRSFHCDLCDKSYYSSQHLNRHKRMSHAILSFARGGSGYCDICGMMSSRIKRHRLSHLLPDGSFNNKCPFCYRHFRKGLQAHIKLICPNRPKNTVVFPTK